MEQIAFDFAPKPAPTLEQRAREFDRENPWVVETLIRWAREARAEGRTRVGAKALIERLRWEHRCRTTGKPYQLNNSYTSVLVRLAAERAPDIAGMFETRRRRRA